MPIIPAQNQLKMLSQAIEHLERAKDEIYSVRIDAEEKENYDLAETMTAYEELIQEIIDSLTDTFLPEED